MENKYEIVRSVSKTIQEKQFEPRTHFSSHKMGFSEVPSETELRHYSEMLLGRATHDVSEALGNMEIKLIKSPEEEYFEKPITPKVFKAKETDPWRITPKVHYMAGGTRENPEKIEITDKILEENTSNPQ